MPSSAPEAYAHPFVARERERERLHHWVRHGWGSAVALLGPHGIGKTALVRQFELETRERGRPFIWLRAGELEGVDSLYAELKERLTEFRQLKSIIVVLDDLGAFPNNEREAERLRELLERSRFDLRQERRENTFHGDLNWILLGERLPWSARSRLPREFYPKDFGESTESWEEPWVDLRGIEMRVMRLAGLSEADLAELLARYRPGESALSIEARRNLAAMVCSRFGGNPAHALLLAAMLEKTGDPLAALRALGSRDNLSIAFNGDALRVTATAELTPAQIHAPGGLWTLIPNLYLPKVGKRWREAIQEFEVLLNRSGLRESHLQSFFEKHPHFLQGLDYSRLVAHPVLERLDGKGNLIPDFFLKPAHAHFADIWDLKMPSAPLIVGTKDRLRLSAAVSEALAQVREYRDYFDEPQNRQRVADRYGLTSYRPNVCIVIGTNNPGLSPEKQRQIFDAVPKDAEVITYDQLLAKMKRHADLQLQ